MIGIWICTLHWRLTNDQTRQIYRYIYILNFATCYNRWFNTKQQNETEWARCDFHALKAESRAGHGSVQPPTAKHIVTTAQKLLNSQSTPKYCWRNTRLVYIVYFTHTYTTLKIIVALIEDQSSSSP